MKNFPKMILFQVHNKAYDFIPLLFPKFNFLKATIGTESEAYPTSKAPKG